MKLGDNFIVTGQQSHCIQTTCEVLTSTRQYWVLIPYVRYQICCNRIHEGQHTTPPPPPPLLLGKYTVLHRV